MVRIPRAISCVDCSVKETLGAEARALLETKALLNSSGTNNEQVMHTILDDVKQHHASDEFIERVLMPCIPQALEEAIVVFTHTGRFDEDRLSAARTTLSL